MKRLLGVAAAVAVLSVVGVLVVLAAGGDGGGERSSPSGDRAQTTPDGRSPEDPERPLEDAWYEDPDGDFMPTAIEEMQGTDPEANECLEEIDCPGISKETGLPVQPKPPSTLLMLDASGSMVGPAGGGQSKIAAARDSLAGFVTESPGSSRLGFAVFGHEGSNRPSGKRQSCAATDVPASVGAVRPQSFPGLLRRFEPTGYTPIAGALRSAPAAFESVEGGGKNRIVLVTDGIETCGGDPVAEARKLKQAGIAVTVDVVGFDIGKASDRERLRRIAKASGGAYTDARTGAELRDYFDDLQRRVGQLITATSCAKGTGIRIRSCAKGANIEASSAIKFLVTDAYEAEDAARAEELERVRLEMDAAHEEYDTELGARFDAIEERLERESEETEERLDDSSAVPGDFASAPRLCPVSPFVRSRMLLPREALLLARQERGAGSA